jgi:DNA-binding NarL/FixJ family response regulator
MTTALWHGASSGRFRVLAVTQSRTGALFVSSLSAVPNALIEVELVDVSRFGHRSADATARQIALVELGSSLADSMSICAALRNTRPGLPQVGLLHCAQDLQSWHIEWLLAGELAGVVDMETAPEQMLATLSTVLSGAIVLEIRARPPQVQIAWPSRGGGPPASTLGVRLGRDDTALVRLASEGESEVELGRQMQLSSHTIHRKLERLRTLLSLRNRIELAAWAGAHGFYQRSRLAERDDLVEDAKGVDQHAPAMPDQNDA